MEEARNQKEREEWAEAQYQRYDPNSLTSSNWVPSIKFHHFPIVSQAGNRAFNTWVFGGHLISKL
jgi:hypothetical protein